MFVLTGFFNTGDLMSSPADTVDEKAARESEMREAKNRYKTYSKKEPTRENLVRSIRVRNATGVRAGETIAALTLMALDEAKDEGLVPDILECFETNPDNWTVRATCARALLNIKKERGVELSRVILSDPKADTETKLLVAIYTVEAGELDGYPVLLDGLLSTKTVEVNLALHLVKLFKKFDGFKIPGTEERIDIEQLLAEVRARKGKGNEAGKDAERE